ncbi:putative bifunctional diguanylate cyclase/phosphodiesterase [Kineococcus rhizosphaerae]|uniref:Diguanylate cyclase (GGDEF)-like protein n=1 Tax=Kineococcus rhizosphaerae TaxID=559628 RepID=A0A2T0R1P0_9ACTN|nr:EAL domain-containing protein [Kineococcus rhizosphaerae]PRY13472.1 diguanylate cyclase (GGDEF)-like protein [Kineococcus rhizosphaerae]
MVERSKAGAAGWVVATAAIAGAYLAPVPDLVRSVLYGLLAVGVLLVSVAVVRRRRPQPAWSWSLVPISATLFLVGSGLRPWAEALTGPLAFAPDPFSLAGYVVLSVGLARLARAAGGLRREVVIDVLVAGLAGAAAAVQFLVLPVLELPGRSTTGGILAGVYPLLDVLVLLLVLDLLLTSPQVVAFRWLGACLGFMLLGDLGYAVLGRRGEFVAPTSFDAPFVVSYFLLAVALVHLPRHVGTGRTRTARFDAWSPARLAVLCLSLLGAVYLASVRGDASPAGQVAAFVLLCTMIGLVLARAVVAVNGHAAAKAVLEHRATHDALTDLPGRDEFERRVDDHLRARAGELAGGDGTRCWLLFVDLDGFKLVNDSYGHVVGDEFLCEVAARLRRLAPAGAVVGRLAGDEFVLAVGGGPGTAVDLATDLLGGLRVPVRLSAGEVAVSASLGIAELTSSFALALREADAAMYRAKAQGRNRFVVWDESLRREIGDEVEFELDLRSAVAEHSLEVHHQAIVSLRTGAPRGVEALLRWNHPLHGSISPVRFIPVLEETGLIVDVGRWVLDTALADLRRWRERGLVGAGFVLSVNVSPRQLLDPFFADTVGELLQAHRVEGASLMLEITESSVLHQDQRTLDLLHRLRALGVGLAVDDFGTGYSALSYLRSFPVTRVKIDRSFVSGVGRSVGDEAVLRAVVAVSDALELAVTAEGVETEEQREVLERLGVAHGQGWWWHRAQSAEETARFLAAWEPEALQPPPAPQRRLKS